ncbi:hypothetical protein H8S20_11290 [Clostridium sp. NSJ-6]|uniref:RNA polymerase sigma-70 region 4 domain-containing protein n=1 Tax=Clostridium hominis TaxID=2763036 RepID=A0ABR7DDI3_9CLOT|nr:sigma factor-like helix-turn-helix DNA-binding protein [Clostridium hominis]MBC5629474.1 hypothetical protein [Clostridium hominis]
MNNDKLLIDRVNEILNINNNNIEENIKSIQDIIDNSLSNIKIDEEYKEVVRELIRGNFNGGLVCSDEIRILAKKHNEEKYTYLIVEKQIEVKGLFRKLISLFKNSKPTSIDTSAYDKNEIELSDKFNKFNIHINSYVKSVKKLEAILAESQYKQVKEKVLNSEDIIEDLHKIIDLINEYNEFKVEQESLVNIVENEEEVVDDVITNSKELIGEELEEIEQVIIKEEISEKPVQLEEVLCNKSDEESRENLNSTKALLIADVFNDNIFKIFLNFCEEYEYITIEDLRGFDFNRVDKLRGFGAGKKQKLIEKYEEVIGGKYITDNDESALVQCSEKVEIITGIQECYINLDISILECFNKINGKLIEQIRTIEISTIDELVKIINDGKFNIPKLGATKIKYVIEALEKLKMEPNNLFSYLITMVKENPDYDILIGRAVNNNTLQQIGESYGITRERVRQKEKKIVNTVEAISDIFISIQNYSDFALLNIKQLLGLRDIDQYEKVWLEYVLRNAESTKYQYFEEVNKFLVNGNTLELRKSINMMVEGLPDIVNIDSELKYELYEYDSLNIFNIEELVNIILPLGYKRVNNYLFRGNVSKEKIYSFIVKEFFKEGISFNNEDDIGKISSMAKEKFDLQEDSIRNIKAKIERSCVLCDRGSYIHPDWVEVDERLLDDIKEFIDNSNLETIYINQIFSQFENELKQIGINNRYYLHGILKLYFNDKYNFTKDTIYRGNVKHDRNYIFDKYIKDKGRVVTKEEMERDLKGWTYIMFAMAGDECKNVLKWDNGSMIHASLINLSLEDLNEIDLEIQRIFESEIDSIIDTELFEKLRGKFIDVFTENNIDCGFKLFSLVECMLSRKYYFRRPYILKNKPKDGISAVKLMKRLFKNNNKVTLNELKDFCNDIKMNDSTRMQSINKLLNETIEIEKETYILLENFEIDESDIDGIKNVIINLVKDKGYLALNGILDYSKFPDIKYEWNSLILKNICKHYIPEIKELKRQFNDKRYPVPIIVEEKSEMNELLDLIIYILKTELKGQDTISISELTDYLKNSNIIYDKMPFEVYNCDELLIEDNNIALI